MSKRDEVRGFIKRRSRTSLAESISSMSDRDAAEKIRVNMDYIASSLAYAIADEYSFIELADIMEWKRTRVRR